MKLLLRSGDCINLLQELPTGSFSAILCDPPYGIEFMKAWEDMGAVRDVNRGNLTNMVNESGKPKFRLKAPSFKLKHRDSVRLKDWHVSWLTEVYRILKVGGCIRVFSSNRTIHRLAQAVSEVGFDVQLESWLYLNGFPKRAERLKPAFEPIILGYK